MKLKLSRTKYPLNVMKLQDTKEKEKQLPLLNISEESSSEKKTTTNVVLLYSTSSHSSFTSQPLFFGYHTECSVVDFCFSFISVQTSSSISTFRSFISFMQFSFHLFIIFSSFLRRDATKFNFNICLMILHLRALTRN